MRVRPQILHVGDSISKWSHELEATCGPLRERRFEGSEGEEKLSDFTLPFWTSIVRNCLFGMRTSLRSASYIDAYGGDSQSIRFIDMRTMA